MKAALILAAGFGTRLRPYTEVIPKPLIPVAGIEPLFFALWRAKCMGAEVFYVNAHYHHRQITTFLEKVASPMLGVKSRVLVEDPILGTGGAIRNLLAQTQPKEFDELLVLNGDTLLGLGNLEDLNAQKNNWCLVSSNPVFLEKYKPLWVDAQSRYVAVGDLSEPNPSWSPRHFLGLHSLKKAALKLLRSCKEPVLEQDLFRGIYRPLADEGLEIDAVGREFSNDEFWFDMTNKEFFLEAQTRLLESLSQPDGCWKEALEARWQQKVQPMGNSWLLGTDPGCVDWQQSNRSVVVSLEKVVQAGALGLDSSVLILRPGAEAFGQGFVRNSLLMSAGLSAEEQAKVSMRADFSDKLENEIIFL